MHENATQMPFFRCSTFLTNAIRDLKCVVSEQVRMFSLETGFEVTLQEERRLSTEIGGSPGGGGTRGGNGTAAATAAAGPTASIVAAEVTSDNGTLAVACADSGMKGTRDRLHPLEKAKGRGSWFSATERCMGSSLPRWPCV